VNIGRSPRSLICTSCGMPWLPGPGESAGELCPRCRGSEGGAKGRDEVAARLARWLVQSQDIDPEAARSIAAALMDRRHARREP
jgi:hypothetical protein